MLFFEKTGKISTLIDSAEPSHKPTRIRERGMRRFKLIDQVQRFLEAHAAVSNLFNLCRHLISASHYRDLRQGTFASWKEITLA
ncbi:putative transposase [Nitrosomonas cryotolerans]|nr:putative transposase [Nitrosomonas cryotolerans]